MMMREAMEFAAHLRRCEKDIRKMQAATEDLLGTIKSVMSAPLPRVYEDMGAGKRRVGGPAPSGAGSGPIVPIGGGDYNADEMSRVIKGAGKLVESEVLAPMERWMNAFVLIQQRMKRLESLRLEVDSRRRTVAKLGKKVDVQRARLPQTRAKGEYEMENTIKILQHKESKLSACRQSYKEHESLVFHQLENVITDSVWLKSYLSGVLRIQSEALRSANAALGEQKARVPGSRAYALPADASSAPVAALPAASAHVDVIAARHDEGLAPVAQANLRSKVARNPSTGAPMGLGHSKDSLYTLDDMPAAPTHRIPASQNVSAAYDHHHHYDDMGYSQDATPAW
ncbi:hypothetical protein QBZ16_003696 [Prototheca wickerhamii]|uniref:BAR domain-containing protein n=1 Tax=Prototheca wickerhamii TaxID=3111 RepID=A0AAD9MNI7_PROWI|nr:hypothetical protein QBZ16_003696 [Prototheca wickerhamii]